VQSFGQGGETELEVLQSASAGDVGFWTGFQSARVKVGDAPEPVTMKLRITELFRRMDGEWKMVHRHADPMAEPAKRAASGNAARGEQSAQKSGASGRSPRPSTPH
jgi:ketosteroid isomerase-like protein